MVAFAANSVIGRAALKSSDEILIDPATYTTIRILFGAIALALVARLRNKRDQQSTFAKRPWLAAGMLALYAVMFSFAYVKLDAASGTLILFAFVQITMVGCGITRGEWPSSIEIAGLVVASCGLVYLVAPALTDSKLVAESLFMMLAGIGWGAYSVLGKGSSDPIADTARNFARAVPFVVIASLLAASQFKATSRGFWLAAASGSITSGLGYVLWYTVLPKLRSAQAAAVQLSVPNVAAIGGVLFAGDSLTTRTSIAGIAILSGIAMTINWKPPAPSE